MNLIVLDGELGVARLGAADPIPLWAAEGILSSITRTAEELSVVCSAAAIPANVQAERAWRGLRVAGRLDFSLTGALASLAAPLAAGNVSIFAVSTFDTDYILVRSHALAAALDCLRAAGHEVIEA
jgi:hypothetical protein